MNVLLKKLHSHAETPFYGSSDAAGADLYSCLEQPLTIKHGEVAMIPTGIAVAIPKGFEIQIRARSGIASKGIIIPNAPGTIDADYRGEIKILLLNLSGTDFTIENHMRIAQAVIAPIIQAEFTLTDSLPETVRGTGGFGSSGTH